MLEQEAPRGGKKPPKLALLIGGGAVLVAAVAVVLVLTLTGGSKDLTVTFSLLDFGGTSTCEGGSGGYSDIGPGTDVVVRDGSNHVIGTSSLGDGKSVALPESAGGSGCVWQTTVKGVPTGEKFYSVEVGRRGAQVYSGSQLDKAHWSVSLELGGN